MSHFREFDRATGFLLPPSVDDWLPERHLARFVIEVIDGLDLSAMVKSYRGTGSAGYHPALLTKPSTFDRRETRCKRSEQHRCGEPEGELCGVCAGFVGGSFSLSDDVVDTLLSICLAQAGTGRDNACHVHSICRCQILVLLKAPGPPR